MKISKQYFIQFKKPVSSALEKAIIECVSKMNRKEQTTVKVVENLISEHFKQNEIIDFGLARISFDRATNKNTDSFVKRLLYCLLQTKTFKILKKRRRILKLKRFL